MQLAKAEPSKVSTEGGQGRQIEKEDIQREARLLLEDFRARTSADEKVCEHAYEFARAVLGRRGFAGERLKELTAEYAVKVSAFYKRGGRTAKGRIPRAGYFLKILWNLVVEIRRQRRRHRHSELEDPGRDCRRGDRCVDPSDLCARSESIENLLEAIGALPEKLRTALRLTFTDGLSRKEAALAAKTTEECMKRRVWRGIEWLRIHLGVESDGTPGALVT